ncbi:hypothetical protein AVEN_271124-1 [Araneus ventricosus]|uniref:Uncharacterized protein n=1 Tax=Araneus ventricosus TaxID=182803 RepID=A0A4Y2E3R5_ARAVE|nr:hypothetical protein AVEN_271124-1 [Araneus ventricosus]
MEQSEVEMKNQILVHVESQVEGIKDHVNSCVGKIEDVQGMKREMEETKQFPGKSRIHAFPVKPLTFDGQTSCIVFKTFFDVVSSTNGWADFMKASQLVASLRGGAAEVLQGIPADKLKDLMTIENALESRFGDSPVTQFYRTQLETRRQKPG